MIVFERTCDARRVEALRNGRDLAQSERPGRLDVGRGRLPSRRRARPPRRRGRRAGRAESAFGDHRGGSDEVMSSRCRRGRAPRHVDRPRRRLGAVLPRGGGGHRPPRGGRLPGRASDIVGRGVRLVEQAVGRRGRFDSHSSLESDRYDVVVDEPVADEAERLLTEWTLSDGSRRTDAGDVTAAVRRTAGREG